METRILALLLMAQCYHRYTPRTVCRNIGGQRCHAAMAPPAMASGPLLLRFQVLDQAGPPGRLPHSAMSAPNTTRRTVFRAHPQHEAAHVAARGDGRIKAGW